MYYLELLWVSLDACGSYLDACGTTTSIQNCQFISAYFKVSLSQIVFRNPILGFLIKWPINFSFIFSNVYFFKSGNTKLRRKNQEFTPRKMVPSRLLQQKKRKREKTICGQQMLIHCLLTRLHHFKNVKKIVISKYPILVRSTCRKNPSFIYPFLLFKSSFP